MKTALLLTFLLLSIQTMAAVNSGPSLQIYADFNSEPFFYETIMSAGCFSINGSFGLSAQFARFSIGGEITDHFVGIIGIPDKTTITGNWNIVCFTATGAVNPVKWFSIRWGIGGGFLYTSINRLSKGYINQLGAGPSFFIDFSFQPPWEYITISLVNRVDLFFPTSLSNPDVSPSQTVPYFYSGIRAAFHPGLEWMDLYIETGILPWLYRSYVVTVNTVLVTWKVGIAIDITVQKRPPPK
jgi:hypothetical protein